MKPNPPPSVAERVLSDALERINYRHGKGKKLCPYCRQSFRPGRRDEHKGCAPRAEREDRR